MAGRQEPGRRRRCDAAQADAGRHAHAGAQGARPPHRGPRPLALEGATPAPRAGPCHLRPHHLGPRPPVPHRWGGGHRQVVPRRSARRSARCLLPHHRGGVHAHPGLRRAGLDPGQARSLRLAPRQGTQTADRGEAQRRRGVREVPRHQVRGHQTVRPRRRRERDPRSGPDPLHGRSRRARFGRDRHGPPRPAQCARQHLGQELRPDLQGVRGPRGPRLGARVRRRQVPPRGDGSLRRPRR